MNHKMLKMLYFLVHQTRISQSWVLLCREKRSFEREECFCGVCEITVELFNHAFVIISQYHYIFQLIVGWRTINATIVVKKSSIKYCSILHCPILRHYCDEQQWCPCSRVVIKIIVLWWRLWLNIGLFSLFVLRIWDVRPTGCNCNEIYAISFSQPTTNTWRIEFKDHISLMSYVHNLIWLRYWSWGQSSELNHLHGIW